MSYGFTPLIYAAIASHAGVVKLLLKRGADGTKTAREYDAAVTALDIARDRAAGNSSYAETFAGLRKRCCSTCGMTSSDGGRAETPQAVRQLPRPWPPREVLR